MVIDTREYERELGAAMRMSEAQKRMLLQLSRWGYASKMRHGPEGEWIELSELIMEQAACYSGGIAWSIADRTAGALLRRGLIERHPEPFDHLVRVSDAGLAALGVTR